jgi:hypothetical protein
MNRTTRTALKNNPAVINISAREVEVFIEDGDSGRADYDATEAAMRDVSALLGWGGYRSGYGSWVLRAGYRADTSDFCDKSSPCHY